MLLRARSHRSLYAHSTQESAVDHDDGLWINSGSIVDQFSYTVGIPHSTRTLRALYAHSTRTLRAPMHKMAHAWNGLVVHWNGLVVHWNGLVVHWNGLVVHCLCLEF